MATTMLSHDEDPKKRAPRKLTKCRKLQRHPSVQYPERLAVGADAHEDVTAPLDKKLQYMNQSVFSLITAAGSRTDFHARFDDDSSGSDTEQRPNLNVPQSEGPRADRAISPQTAPEQQETSVTAMKPGKETRKGPDDKFLRSLPRLNRHTIEEKNYMSQSLLLPPLHGSSSPEEHTTSTPRDAPVMSRMLEAEAQYNKSAMEMQTVAGAPSDPIGATKERVSTSLATRLMEIFGFENPEQVVSEYPCWLMQSVLLQGYMYITENHICFYAYLPKRSNTITKSGHLSKRGKQNPKFNRYWFTLKGDILSYYTDPSHLYFPRGNIDLRYGISAALSETKEKGKDVVGFTVTTHQRTYFFKADSSTSAKEWVKTLQKVIFRSHNDGDSVKISLPIENVMDIEESPVVEFADTVKIRVVDSDETYVIDEYFFSFFSFGADALNVLRAMIDQTSATMPSQDYLSPISRREGNISPSDCSRNSSRSPNVRSQSPFGIGTPTLRESVRATLPSASLSVSDRASPRISGDWGRSSMDANRRSMDIARELNRASFDERGRRSASTSRMGFGLNGRTNRSPSSLKPQGSCDSYVHSMEPSTESSAPNQSSDETHASASQILDRSDVFNSPTIHHDEKSPEAVNGKAKPSSMGEQIEVHPPSRSQTDSSLQKPKIFTKLNLRRASSSKGRESIGAHHRQAENSNPAPTLQQLVKAGSYPLQRAAGFAGYLGRRSKKMSNLLATESMGYVEKVSGMWAGGRKHYGDGGGITPEERCEEEQEGEDTNGHDDRFRAHFALPASERLRATYFGFLHRVLPLYGKIYISNRKFCFRSLLPGTRTKMILPLKDIENVDKEKGFRFGYSGLVVVIRGFEELFFEFSRVDVRDDCAVTLLQGLESIKFLQESGLLTQEDKAEADIAKAEHRMLQEARIEGYDESDLALPRSDDTATHPGDAAPIIFDDPRVSIINFKPTESLRITCLTIGSRGDVQPYIALCKGFLAEGHRPRIASHAEFEPWVRKHGIDFAPVDGDPAELMRICVENGMFTLSFLKEASLKFRGWIDDLLSSAWKACQDSDLLIESPSAMAGIHIAEALAIPYFRAFTMPWTRTRAYPHAFAVPEHKMGGAYNYVTYVMFDNVFWTAIAGQVNRWRKKELGLRSTNLDKLHPNKVPFLYNFSPSVVVPPLDYSDWIRVTGYWFLDEGSDWSPPKELAAFIKQARADGKKLVYIGFGSIVVSDPAALTKTVIESVLKADVRCILSKGWSDRLGTKDATLPEIPLPPEILQIKSAPHDWLFRQIDAAAHHGGAGTTGASLRAGVPTIVKPFFGDQFFFGSRLEDLGVGICLKKLNVTVFSRALWQATHSERMIGKAKLLGEQIRQEDGVGTAIQAIYRDLEYAKTLIKNGSGADNDLGDEESWTFIGDENDPELARQIAEWEPMGRGGTHTHGLRRSMVLLPGEVSAAGVLQRGAGAGAGIGF